MSKITDFGKNCNSAEKGLKGPYLAKHLMASYLARCPNPCTNCLEWMPFSTSQWFLNPYSGHFFICASLLSIEDSFLVSIIWTECAVISRTVRCTRRTGSCAVKRPSSPWLRPVTAHRARWDELILCMLLNTPRTLVVPPVYYSLSLTLCRLYSDVVIWLTQ